MVENFTTIDTATHPNDLRETIAETDDQFEVKIKMCIQRLAKEPSQSVVEKLLDYSRSLKKE
ncbi:hypothetical protein G5B30_15355 [Sphingobacterium sp. SGG-5]|uniref:hypothetical protein n=1 Tax=Sphingobacterium sp. SGG-5 TaxID=2710881 RepID=UPI0013ED72A3|nr:hypothetical protein [Sphingobacterium sp. SGG-5]NGM63285.1 hypothetical protein [Sphingobacterium sp. SGG-5]